jgi:WD40 repeat protein
MSGGLLCPSLAAGRRIEHAAFSPDGRRVVVSGEDGAACVWDAATGEALTPPLRHGGTVVYAAFSPDGRRLLTAGEDRTARVWDSVTGELLAPPLRLTRAFKHASFSADGNHAIVVNEEGDGITWDLTADSRPVAELVALAQVLSASCINKKQERQPLDVTELHSAWAMLRSAR